MSWRGRDTALKITGIAEFKAYLQGLRFSDWRPSGMTLHNTASPSRARWDAYPGEQWLRNLKSYYQGLGWSAGPHAFVDGDAIWIMTDFNTRGVHSPSWNGTRLGIEMVADFAKEDDETGVGLRVKKQAAALFAACHEFFGWEASMNSIKLHKEDPATDHDCPGKNIVKADFVRMVAEAMGDGGDLPHDVENPAPVEPRTAHVSVAAGDTLNIRESSSAGSRVIVALPNWTKVSIIGEAMNGATKWYRLELKDNQEGWGSAAYVVPGEPDAKIRHEDITCTVFGGPGDQQDSAYGGRVNGNKPGAAVPYKFRQGPPPALRVTGPKGTAVVPIVDLGPWNLDNPEYVLHAARPLAEKQYRDKSRAQNGMIPTNGAGLDLTPAAAKLVGISGKGKVSWEFA